MAIKSKMVLIGAASGKVLEDSTPKMMKEALQDAIAEWHDSDFPNRFKSGAAGKYNYSKRSDKYNKRKRKKMHHTQPLIYSGDMKRQMERRIDISGTSKLAKGSLLGPRYLYIKHKSKSGNEIDKVTEILTMPSSEEQNMAKTVEESLLEQIDALQNQEVIEA